MEIDFDIGSFLADDCSSPSSDPGDLIFSPFMPPLFESHSPKPLLAFPKQEPPPITPVARPKREKAEPKNPRGGKKAKIETPKGAVKNGAIHPVFDKSQVVLSKEELLSLSSNQHEEFLSHVRSNRDLSASEKENAKKQRRLIKNRESAQASRQRKKNYVEELEKKLADLQHENDKLNQTASSLTTENLLLQNQVDSLKPSIPCITPILNRPIPMYKTQAWTSGLLVLVILFSFGVMLGNIGLPTGALNFESVAPISTRILDREGFKQLSNSDCDVLLNEDPAIPFVGRLKLNQALSSDLDLQETSHHYPSVGSPQRALLETLTKK